MPNGMTLTIGVKSWTVAAAMLDGPLTMFTGRTESDEGALPMEHEREAP